MIALLFLLIAVGMVAAIFDKMRLAYGSYTLCFLLSLFWFKVHATDKLSIVL